jgi:hypothetical protein
MFLALSPCAFSRAWVAVRKSFVIASWQVAHSSEPTNSAPGILGGAMIARFDSKLLQERRTSVIAAPPETSHQRLFRRLINKRRIAESRTSRSLTETQRGWLRIFTG